VWAWSAVTEKDVSKQNSFTLVKTTFKVWCLYRYLVHGFTYTVHFKPPILKRATLVKIRFIPSMTILKYDDHEPNMINIHIHCLVNNALFTNFFGHFFT